MAQTHFSTQNADPQAKAFAPPPPDRLSSDFSGSQTAPLAVIPANPKVASGNGGKNRRLKQLLLLTVLPVALLPIAVEALTSYVLTQNNSRQAVNEALSSQTLLTSRAVGQQIANEFTFMELLGQSPVVADQMTRAAAQAGANNLIDLPIPVLEDRFSLTRLLEPNQPLNRFLAQAATAEELGEIIITDKNGFTVGYSRRTSDFVQSDEDWWQQAQAQTRWISSPTLDESTNIYGIELSQRIQSADSDEFLGVMKVLVTTLEFDALPSLLSNVGLRGSQQVQIVDPKANLALVTFKPGEETVYSSPENVQTITGDQTVADLANRLVEANDRDTFPDVETIQQQLQADFPVQKLEVSTVGQTDNEQAGQQIVVASFVYQGKQYKVATVPDLAWVTTASMDVSEIQAAGRTELLISTLLAIALGAGATVLTIALSRQLSAPLDDLADVAQQMAKGNLNISATPKGSSETRTLANTFNSFALRMQDFLREQNLNAHRATLAANITGTRIVDSAHLLPIYERLVTEIREVLGSDRVVIYQFNPDWSGQIVAESAGEGLSSAFEQQLGDPCIPTTTLEKYQTEGILLENNVATAPFHPEHLALLHNLEVQSILGVPIVSEGRLYGLLITHHCQAVHAWQAAEIDFLKQLGLQLALVIERVKLIEQTQHLAEEQRLLKESLQHNALQLLMDVDPVSQGNLTVRAKVTEDEIGTLADSYNATIANLRKIVVQVQAASRQVADTTDTSQTSVRTLAKSADQQAATILAALDRVQDMTTSVQLVATNAEKAEAAVLEAERTVAQGDDAMNRTVDGIMAIRETVADTAKKVKRLGESSQKISNVVNLISGFAAQTNMLALNASIEASRAGEGGKGFAVVAEEVRELARQSAEATTEIEKLVASIQAETNAVVIAMETGTEQVVTGTQLVDETRQSLNQITDVSRQISALVAAIADATVVQSQASKVVSETMTNVATTASQNSSAANQVADAFTQLRSVAQALQEEVGRFTVS